MGAYIVKVTNGADVGTIENQIDMGFRYTDVLNNVNIAEIKISSLGSVKRGLIAMGAEVEISRNGTVEFKGLLDSIDTLDAGGENIHVSGKEIRLAQEKGAYVNSPWKATASATIAAEIIAESSYFSAGTVEAGVSIDFRLSKTQSLWGGLGNLSTKTGQDIQIDYPNDEVDILDHRGSTTSVAVLNDGIQIKNIRVSTTYPRGNDVKVYGKGDGDGQIESDDAQGQDASSKTTYGTIREVIIDRSIISVSEANSRANLEVAKIKDPTKVYDFEVINPNAVITTGDVLTLNSQDKDLTNESVRVVGLERGIIGNKEYLKLQVTNAAYSKLVLATNQALGRIQKDNVDATTYMQGSGNTNTWGQGINAKTDFPLKVGFFLPQSYIEDEAGNSNVKEFTVSYDIDPYNNQFGTASFDGTDPQVQNNSGNTQPDVENSSGSTEPDVEDNSGSTGPTVTGNSGLNWSGTSIGSDSNTSVSCSSGSWTVVATVNTTNTGNSLYANFYVKGNSGGPEDIQVKIKNSGEITGTDSRFGVYQDGFRDDSFTRADAVSAGLNDLSDAITVEVYPFTGAIVVDAFLSVYESSHNHDDGTYAAASHLHSDGTYNAVNHNHADGTYNAANHGHPDGTYDVNAADIDNISIGDDVSEAGSVNAVSVNLYLDFYNTGTSTWDNKHSILATGLTIDTDVDISNSGTYPDAAGFWRVRVEPITVNADFAQATVKLRNAVDN